MPEANALTQLHEEAGASFISFGPAQSAVNLVDTFGAYEAEYAAIRKGVGLMSLPQRGVVEVTGPDRLEFLHRLLTNEIASLQPGQGRRALLLNRNGRIAADVTVLHEPDRTWLETDLIQASQLATALDQYLFTEKVQLRDVSDQYLHLALHGPLAGDLLANAGAERRDDAGPLENWPVTLAGNTCRVFRRDEVGALGLGLITPRHGAIDVYRSLLAALDTAPLHRRARTIGWSAYNTARIEAGTPCHHIDFGPDSLPAETGILDQTVNFNKGCYLGQEVVARMQNLGHPKRVLVGLRLEDDRLPIAGTPVHASSITATTTENPDEPGEKTSTNDNDLVGAVTSSCVSPILGGKAIALAVVRWDMRQHGQRVTVAAEGQAVLATVGPLASLSGQIDGN